MLVAKEQERLGILRDFVISGHRHIDLDLQITGSSRVVILGDCFQQWIYGRLQENRFELINYER